MRSSLSRAPLAPARARHVSAEFASPDAVDRALLVLSTAGLPRDLVEVVVSAPAARRFYGGVAQGPGRETLRYAGLGALIGLVIGAAVALGMLAVGAVRTPGFAALAQLLGPNVTAIAGAGIGALIGSFVRRPSADRYARAGATEDAIIIVVLARRAEEASTVADLLASCGGREVRLGDDR